MAGLRNGLVWEYEKIERIDVSCNIIHCTMPYSII